MPYIITTHIPSVSRHAVATREEAVEFVARFRHAGAGGTSTCANCIDDARKNVESGGWAAVDIERLTWAEMYTACPAPRPTEPGSLSVTESQVIDAYNAQSAG